MRQLSTGERPAGRNFEARQIQTELQAKRSTITEAAIVVITPPLGIIVEETDLGDRQPIAGNKARYILPRCALLVVLVHAAEYERWAL